MKFLHTLKNEKFKKKYMSNSQMIYGVLLNICGSILISFGTNTVQYSFDKNKWLWIFGYCLFIIGNVLNFVSLSYATQVILSSVSCSALILSNNLFNYFVKKVKFTLNSIMSSGLLLGGVILIISFSNNQAQEYSADEMIGLYREFWYITFLIVELILIFVFSGIYLKYQNSYSYVIMCCMIGTHSIVFSKSLSVLLKKTLNGHNQFNNFFTYLIIILLVITSVFWVVQLNKILQKYNNDYCIVAVQQSLWMLFSIISSGIYFKEFENFSSFETIIFLIGISLIIMGISIIKPCDDDRVNDSIDVGCCIV